VAARSVVDVERQLDRPAPGCSTRRSGALFGHVTGPDLASRFRRHVSCFADQVYPIQALSRLHASAVTRRARGRETVRGPHRVAAGPAGQWWWHYDAAPVAWSRVTPVYSVHQHAMGPMALLDLADAGGQVDWDCHPARARLDGRCARVGRVADPGRSGADPSARWPDATRASSSAAPAAVASRAASGHRLAALDRLWAADRGRPRVPAVRVRLAARLLARRPRRPSRPTVGPRTTPTLTRRRVRSRAGPPPQLARPDQGSRGNAPPNPGEYQPSGGSSSPRCAVQRSSGGSVSVASRADEPCDHVSRAVAPSRSARTSGPRCQQSRTGTGAPTSSVSTTSSRRRSRRARRHVGGRPASGGGGSRRAREPALARPCVGAAFERGRAGVRGPEEGPAGLRLVHARHLEGVVRRGRAEPLRHRRARRGSSTCPGRRGSRRRRAAPPRRGASACACAAMERKPCGPPSQRHQISGRSRTGVRSSTRPASGTRRALRRRRAPRSGAPSAARTSPRRLGAPRATSAARRADVVRPRGRAAQGSSRGRRRRARAPRPVAPAGAGRRRRRATAAAASSMRARSCHVASGQRERWRRPPSTAPTSASSSTKRW
jgi:hypothetical protein